MAVSGEVDHRTITATNLVQTAKRHSRGGEEWDWVEGPPSEVTGSCGSAEHAARRAMSLAAQSDYRFRHLESWTAGPAGPGSTL